MSLAEFQKSRLIRLHIDGGRLRDALRVKLILYTEFLKHRLERLPGGPAFAADTQDADSGDKMQGTALVPTDADLNRPFFPDCNTLRTDSLIGKSDVTVTVSP